MDDWIRILPSDCGDRVMVKRTVMEEGLSITVSVVVEGAEGSEEEKVHSSSTD